MKNCTKMILVKNKNFIITGPGWLTAGSLPLCAPGGARFQRVKVSNPPGSGKDIAESKGVRRETESEGS
uniref:hypothetical protein n=1 Tax=Blautia sp. TaxID=1955243 RepID=UPI003AB5D2DD